MPGIFSVCVCDGGEEGGRGWEGGKRGEQVGPRSLSYPHHPLSLLPLFLIYFLPPFLDACVSFLAVLFRLYMFFLYFRLPPSFGLLEIRLLSSYLLSLHSFTFLSLLRILLSSFLSSFPPSTSFQCVLEKNGE